MKRYGNRASEKKKDRQTGQSRQKRNQGLHKILFGTLKLYHA